MWQAVAAGIGAAGSILGGVLQNNSAKAQANRQMEFQEDMSNTSYQRAMEDMRAAGLNPILAAKVGGASTPSGAAAPVQNVVGPAVSTALQTQQIGAQVENMQATTAKTEAETLNIQAQTAALLAKKDFEQNLYSMSGEALKGGKAFAESLREEIQSIPQKIRLNAPKIAPVVRDILTPDFSGVRGFSNNSAKSVSPNTPRMPPGYILGPNGWPIKVSDTNPFNFPKGVLKPPRINER